MESLRRRRRPLIVVASLVLVAAVLAALFWPPRYSSTGTILIEQQELPSELVRSTISSYASQRIEVIQQRVMTTDNLMKIIERYDLYADMRKRRAREEVVAQMRRDSQLQMISADVIDPRDGRPTKATIAFSVGYSNRSPQLAAKVANELVSLYLQQNIESRQQSSRDAAVFLGGESDRLSKEINEEQAGIATFKEKHANELPELSQLNQQAMTRTEEEIRDTDTQVQAQQQQLVYLDAQLAQINPTAQIYASTGERVQSPNDRLKYLRTEYARAAALYSPDHPDVQRLKREIAGLEAGAAVEAGGADDDYRRQLQDAQTDLADAQKRYSPDHPDVVRLQRLVDGLQTKVQATSATGAASATAAKSAHDAAVDDADNPAYIQIRAQRQATANQLQGLQAKQVALKAKLDDYERRVDLMPQVERDYNGMLRDLTSAQTQYAQIRQRQMEAQIAENLETERKGERFTLIEPPFTPEEPASPNRPLILIFGLMLALAAGFGTVALLESTDRSVRGRHDLQQLLAAPPLAMIPIMLTSADQAIRRRWRRTAFAGAAGSLIVALLMVHFLYRPLDVIWTVTLRRFGLEG